MAFHDDLLDQAFHLARLDRNRPRQANLRRSVSTAYYALFHLLVSEAVSYWRLERHRAMLARSFEHGRMKRVCNNCPQQNTGLRSVAEAFVELQQARHSADYDSSVVWVKSDVLDQVEMARAAFATWPAIRNHTLTQDFLLALFTDRK